MISNWLFVGIGVLSVVLGYTVGVSSSPIASAIIPALFTLMTGALAIVLRKNISESKVLTSTKYFGVFLLIISTTYFGGTVLGANARESGALVFTKNNSGIKEFPWKDLDDPADISVALDWITVQEVLLGMGYTNKQINTLYVLPGAQRYSGIGIYGQTQRLSDLLLPGDEKPVAKNETKPKTIVDTDLFKDDGA